MKALFLLLVVIAALIAVIVLLPLGVIVALNTLFGLTIPFGFDTWISVVILYLFLNAAGSTSIKIKR